MPKPKVEDGNAQRLLDCDTYHAPFDAVARTFHDDFNELIAARGVDAIDEVHDEIADAQREHLIIEMFGQLDAKSKLDLMARLTGNIAIQTFLRDLAEKQSAYDVAINKIEVVADEYDLVNVADIPGGALVNVYMTDVEDVIRCASDKISELPCDRSIELRALGDGTFKILTEYIAYDSLEIHEAFVANDVVRIGAVVRQGKMRRLEPSIRWQESFGVAIGDKTYPLHLPGYNDGDPDIQLVVTSIEIDGRTMVPYGGEED